MRRRSSKYQNRWTQLRSELGIAKKPKSGYHDTWRLWGKPRNSYYRQWSFNPRKFEPSKHKRSLLAVFIISIMLFVGLWAQDPSNVLFHGNKPSCAPDYAKPGAPCQDPSQVIWQATAPKANLGEFNTFGTVSYSAGCQGGGTSCFTELAGASSTAIALSNVTIGDLAIASKSLLAFHMTLGTAQVLTQGVDFGWYLTTNATVPQHAIGSTSAYNPASDPSVVLQMLYECTANCGGATPTYLDEARMLRTIGKSDTLLGEDKGSSPSSSVYLTNSQTFTPSVLDSALYLNYTGVVNGSACTVSGSPGVIGPAPGCSWLLNQQVGGSALAASWVSTQILPWFQLQVNQYYIGFYTLPSAAGPTIFFTFNNGGANGNMDIFQFVPSAAGPTIDTGGFFGPVIKALINLGVIILNAILGFIAFITPALETAFNFLETIVKTVLNGIGVAFGFPASPGLGDNLFSFINSVITLFTVQVPNAFGQITPIFNSWLNLLTVVFTTGPVGEIFKLLADILGFAVNLVAFAWTVFNLAALTYSIATPWWLFIFAIAFNCDDGVDGWIKTWEFAKWLAFDIGVKTVTWLLNWTIDVLTAAIGFIPKPFIQMASAKFPRIPVIDVHGSFTMPRFDGAALKEGNLFAVFGFPSIMVGLIWYELTQTSIPGTLASLYSTQPWVNTATVAITFYKIFLPIFGLTIFLLMIPTLFSNIFGVRVQGGMPVSIGRRPSGVVLRGGGGGPIVRKSKKHLQGRLERIVAERESIEKRARQASEKASLTREKKEKEDKAQKELSRQEIERRPSGKDIKGPRLGPLDQE